MRVSTPMVVAAALTFACCGCSEKTPVEPPGTPPVPPEAILVWFTRIDVPDSIDPTDTLIVRLSGVAGSNLCYSFDHLEAARTISAVEITGHGFHDKSAVACPAAISTFENIEQVVLPPFPLGQFRVVALQPDGSRMERAVNVGPRADEPQIFQLISAQSEIYSLLALDCVPPIELRRTSPPLFTVYADSALSFSEGCVPNSTVETDVMQRTAILADSIYFHERVWTGVGMEGARSAVSTSDGAIRFRIPDGRQLQCTIGGTLWVANPGGANGTASSWLALSRVGQEGTTVLYGGTAQTPPGPPQEGYFSASFRRVLEPGDYLYEAHLSAQALYPSGNPMGELWLRLKFRDVTTDVERSTWGAVKVLDR